MTQTRKRLLIALGLLAVIAGIYQYMLSSEYAEALENPAYLPTKQINYDSPAAKMKLVKPEVPPVAGTPTNASVSREVQSTGLPPVLSATPNAGVTSEVKAVEPVANSSATPSPSASVPQAEVPKGLEGLQEQIATDSDASDREVPNSQSTLTIASAPVETKVTTEEPQPPAPQPIAKPPAQIPLVTRVANHGTRFLNLRWGPLMMRFDLIARYNSSVGALQHFVGKGKQVEVTTSDEPSCENCYVIPETTYQAFEIILTNKYNVPQEKWFLVGSKESDGTCSKKPRRLVLTETSEHPCVVGVMSELRSFSALAAFTGTTRAAAKGSVFLTTRKSTGFERF